MSLERFTRGSALRTALLFVVAAYAGALLAFAGAAGVVLRESPSRHAGGNVNRAGRRWSTRIAGKGGGARDPQGGREDE